VNPGNPNAEFDPKEIESAAALRRLPAPSSLPVRESASSQTVIARYPA
jgi:hypothetical protein